MRVWAVANQKGGVGKTTTTVTLAGLLAEQGQRVLMVDLDPHGSLTSYFGYDPDTVTQSSYQIFQAEEALQPQQMQALVAGTSLPGLGLIPTSAALATVERQMTGKDGMGLRVARALTAFKDEYDYVLLDCPPVLGVLMINALAACERLVCPVQTEFLALKGLERMTRTLQMVQKARPRDLAVTIVPTMFDRRTQASVSSLNSLRKYYPTQLWRSAIPVDTRLRDASKRGLVPSAYAPDSRAVRAYRQLLAQLVQDEKAADTQLLA
ncbi:MAG: ParA family protein [Pseudomonadales bacterium]|nr:ParA family protein [Pseudomonadales bacterium]